MPHIYVVWSMSSILGLLFWGVVGLVFIGFGLLLLAENVKRRFLRLFRSRK